MKKLYTLILILTFSQISAQIVYNDIQDVTIAGPSGLYNLDIDGGGQTDFVLQTLGSFANGYTVVQAGSAGSPLNGILENASAEVRNTSFGTSIDANSPTWNPVTNDVVFVIFLGQAYTADYLAPNNMGYVGCKFAIGNTVHYGWVRVYADNQKCELTIYEYAYEATPNTAIMAGDMGIATTIGEANTEELKIYTKDDKIYLKNNGEQSLDVTVTNLAGKIVKSYTVYGAGAKIDVSDLVPNLYIVTVISKDGNTLEIKSCL